MRESCAKYRCRRFRDMGWGIKQTFYYGKLNFSFMSLLWRVLGLFGQWILFVHRNLSCTNVCSISWVTWLYRKLDLSLVINTASVYDRYDWSSKRKCRHWFVTKRYQISNLIAPFYIKSNHKRRCLSETCRYIILVRNSRYSLLECLREPETKGEWQKIVNDCVGKHPDWGWIEWQHCRRTAEASGWIQ